MAVDSSLQMRFASLLGGNYLRSKTHLLMKDLSSSVIVITALVLASCVTASEEKQANIQEFLADPLMCTEIRLRGDVPIKNEIIHEASIMGDRLMIVLRYREGGDEREFTPNLMPGYNNISLVSEVEENTNGPLIVYRRYAVIEMWRLHPEKKAKVCYMWTIGDDSVSMKVMLEDFSGQFFAERPVSVNPEDCEKLKAFCEQLMKTMLKTLKQPIPGA